MATREGRLARSEGWRGQAGIGLGRFADLYHVCHDATVGRDGIPQALGALLTSSGSDRPTTATLAVPGRLSWLETDGCNQGECIPCKVGGHVGHGLCMYDLKVWWADAGRKGKESTTLRLADGTAVQYYVGASDDDDDGRPQDQKKAHGASSSRHSSRHDSSLSSSLSRSLSSSLSSSPGSSPGSSSRRAVTTAVLAGPSAVKDAAHGGARLQRLVHGAFGAMGLWVDGLMA